MSDRIQLNLPYHYLTLDGQPQIVLSGSVIDVPSAAAYPSATVVSKGGGAATIPAGSHAVSTPTVKTR